ncbi:MAG TPA: hypothetical protein PKD64_05080 [Pirellulaceae bacterium]|nr:hypothetical protein [Pirellulaceae bacterium]HMO91549.1 hypothetical protein [Pirellulaceae bacterium]HMP68246.1 hypothetical protein [Pirellulaceae bacterium]
MSGLVAQNFAVGYTIIGLCIGLGLIAVCVPRRRKPFSLEDPTTEKRVKVVVHQAAGSIQKKSTYAQQRKG